MNYNPFSKANLPITSIAITVILAVAGYFVNSQIQNQFAEMELQNRIYNYRPKIELKNISTSNIVFVRSKNMFVSKVDFNKDNQELGKSIIPMELEAKFNLTFINNSDNIADIINLVYFDTLSEVPQSLTTLIEQEVNDTLVDGYVQLDYLDSTKFDYTRKIYYLDENGIFYIHLRLFYENKFSDMYESYFVIKGKIDSPDSIYVPKNNKYNIRIEKLYLKDSAITLYPPKKYLTFIRGDEKADLEEKGKMLIDKTKSKKRIFEDMLKRK